MKIGTEDAASNITRRGQRGSLVRVVPEKCDANNAPRRGDARRPLYERVFDVHREGLSG